jgi:hypothetical protein
VVNHKGSEGRENEMNATAPVRDELVASSAPRANTALHTGHLLYAAEVRVTTAREWALRPAPARMQEKRRGRLADAVAERDRLDEAYRDALASVRATDPDTADLVDDAVWRIHLFDIEPA